MDSSAGGRQLAPTGAIAAASLLLIVAIGIAVSLGAVRLSPDRLIGGLFDTGDAAARQIVWHLRLPRVLVAALVGANLSLAGVLLQGVTRNPLAGPHVLGLSAGAGFAAITVVVIAPGAPVELAAPAAFAGAIAAALVVYGLAWRGGISPVRFALSGVATAALFAALSTAVLASSDLFTQSVLSFLGLGIQPPIPSWGNLLTNAQELIFSSPALAFYPGTLIFLTVIAFNFLGDGLQDALDPKATA